MPSKEEWEQVVRDLHTLPSRKEWLANAIIEIDREISELIRKKVEYEGEFHEIEKQENKQ